ncbi:hypothetical protein PMAYCL1PPCAC_04149, partial [Pristionchus mayeri]
LYSLSSLGQLAPLQFQAMRFLSVLLIALALLPLSTALKCHLAAKTPDGSAATEQTCGAGQDYCTKMKTSDGTIKGCIANAGCDAIGGAKCQEKDGATMCCCKGDLCNPAATPTALLPLAAVAAAVAARF